MLKWTAIVLGDDGNALPTARFAVSGAISEAGLACQAAGGYCIGKHMAIYCQQQQTNVDRLCTILTIVINFLDVRW
jgi:hypothetical protein